MNKQIEEMEIALHEAQHEYDKAWHECFQNKGKRPERENVFYAKYLVEKKGYRRQEDIVREILTQLKKEIEAALESNYKARKERNERGYYDFDDALLSCIVGKINALRGILDYIEELKKKYGVQDDTE